MAKTTYLSRRRNAIKLNVKEDQKYKRKKRENQKTTLI